VKSFTCGLGALVIAAGLAGVSGCGTDNESDANKASPDLPKPGAPAKAVETPPTPTSMEDYIKTKNSAATSSVPGASGATKKQ
jgi:hypothetical protein